MTLDTGQHSQFLRCFTLTTEPECDEVKRPRDVWRPKCFFLGLDCMEAAMLEKVWWQQCSSKTYADGRSGMQTEMKKSKTNAMMLIGDEDGAMIMMTRRDIDCKCYEVDWRWGCMNWKNSNGCISIYSLGPDDYELDQPTKSDHNHQDGRPALGTGCPTKTDEFLENLVGHAFP